MADQSRYINPLRVASAVAPSSVVKAGIRFGSFGVAIHATKQIAVPFVVGDGGPKIGEGSPALARQLAGMAVSDAINLKNRFDGQVDRPDVHQKEVRCRSECQSCFRRLGWLGKAVAVPGHIAQAVKARRAPDM